MAPLAESIMAILSCRLTLLSEFGHLCHHCIVRKHQIHEIQCQMIQHTYLQRISKLDFCFIDRMSIGGYKIVIRADKRPLQQTYANSSNCNCGCCQKIGNVRFCARTSRYWKITINTLSRHETHR